MKKKIVTLSLVVALAATALIGGTLAYFTDADSAENVMTLGGVDIVQNEQQRKDDGTLEDFTDWKSLMPMVDTREDKENDPVVVNGFFNPDMKNVVDKIITVTNTADSTVNADNKQAYVRTLIAFEGRCDVQGEYIGKLWNKKDWNINWVPKVVDDVAQPTTIDQDGRELVNAREVVIKGVVHTVIECIYVGEEFGLGAGVLPAGKTTPASLKQVFLADTADNEVATWFGNEYTIYALTQATQVQGFEDAETALDTAFGDPMTVSDQVIYDWFKDIQ